MADAFNFLFSGGFFAHRDGANGGSFRTSRNFVHKLAHRTKKSVSAHGPKFLIDCNLLVGARGFETSDLTVPNYERGKNVSICLFESCSHQEISRFLHPLPFFTIRYRLSAENSVHKLATINWVNLSVETVFNWRALL